MVESLEVIGAADRSLSGLFEGVLFGLHQASQELLADSETNGEDEFYWRIGELYDGYLRSHEGCHFDAEEPLERARQVLEAFGSRGFFRVANLQRLSENQLLLNITEVVGAPMWNETDAWEHGVAPCPLWLTLRHNFSLMGLSVRIVKSVPLGSGCSFEHTLDLRKTAPSRRPNSLPTDAEIAPPRQATATLCMECHQVKVDRGWQSIERYLAEQQRQPVSHGLCPDCYPKMVG